MIKIFKGIIIYRINNNNNKIKQLSKFKIKKIIYKDFKK